MFDAFPHNAAAGSQPSKHSRTHGSRRQSFIQCRQCTEQFARSTVVCPRCDRMNDRSPVMLGLKFLAVVLFVCTVTWVVRVAANHSGPAAGEQLFLPANAMPASASQPDLRF